MSSPRRTSLAEQGRQLTALRQRIESIREDAEVRAHAAPQRAARIHADAEAEVAPLIAEGAALRDALVQRAQQRARLAWRVVYVGCAAIILLVAAYWLANR